MNLKIKSGVYTTLLAVIGIITYLWAVIYYPEEFGIFIASCVGILWIIAMYKIIYETLSKIKKAKENRRQEMENPHP